MATLFSGTLTRQNAGRVHTLVQELFGTDKPMTVVSACVYSNGDMVDLEIRQHQRMRSVTLTEKEDHVVLTLHDTYGVHSLITYLDSNILWENSDFKDPHVSLNVREGFMEITHRAPCGWLWKWRHTLETPDYGD